MAAPVNQVTPDCMLMKDGKLCLIWGARVQKMNMDPRLFSQAIEQISLFFRNANADGQVTDLLKEFRGEFVEVIAPIDPGVAAGGLFINDVKAMLFEHIDGGFGSFDEEIIFTGGEPDELESFLEF